MILRALVSGCRRAWRLRRALLPLYLLSLASSLLVALPAWRILADFAGRSLAAEALRSGFEAAFIFELMARRGEALATLGPLLVLAALLSFGGNLFLSAGVMTCMARDGYVRPRLLWGGAAALFGRFVRLVAWSVLPLLVLALVAAVPRILQRLVWGADPYQSVTTWVGRITVGVAIFALLIQLTILDHARLDIVERDERATRKALWRAVKKVLRRFLLLVGATLLVALAGLLVLFLYRQLAGWSMGPSVVAIVVLVVLQQLTVVARLGTRLWRWSTAYEIRQRLSHFRREEMPPTQVLLTPSSGELDLRPLPLDEPDGSASRTFPSSDAPPAEEGSPPDAVPLTPEAPQPTEEAGSVADPADLDREPRLS